MGKLIKRIDPWLVLIVGIIVICWVLAGGYKTPASEILVLQESTDPELWIEALECENRTVRNYARENLFNFLPPESLEVIALIACDSPETGIQLSGLWILAHVEIPNRGEIAARFLDNDLRDIQEAALDVLAHDPVPEIHDELLEFTNDPDIGIRAASLKVLASLGNPDDLSTFISFLGESNSSVREAAREGILSLGSNTPDIILVLLGAAHNTSEITAAREALKLIGEIGGTDALDGLFAILEDGDGTLSSEAATAIGKIGGESAESRALAVFLNSDGHIKSQTALILGALGVTEARDYLVAAYRDEFEDFWVRHNSLEALATCGNESLVPEIIEFLSNPGVDSRLVKAGTEVLAAYGDTKARDYLWAVVQDESEDFMVRYYSMEALATCGDESLVADMIEFIDTPGLDPRMVKMGIEALGGIGGDRVIELYDAIISDETDLGLNRKGGETALISVISGLGRMNNEESRVRLREILRVTEIDSFAILREAIESLGVVGAPDDIKILRELSYGPFLENFANDAIAMIEKSFSEETTNDN